MMEEKRTEDQDFNDLAALTSSELSEEEKTQILRRLASTPDGMRLLAAAELPEDEKMPKVSLPFRIVGTFRGGVCKGFIQPFAASGLSLGKQVERLREVVRNITGNACQICLKKSMTLEVDLPGLQGQVTVSAHQADERLRVQVCLEPEDPVEEYVEVWEDGILRHVFLNSPGESPPILRMRPGGSLSIRNAHSSFGVGLRLSPVSFGLTDWLSACLCAALDGDFKGALSILREEIGVPKLLPLSSVQRVSAMLHSIGSFAKCDGFTLCPLPATRSLTTASDTSEHVLRGVWEGIMSCWPDAVSVGNPWADESTNPASDSKLPNDVRRLTEAVVRSVETGTLSEVESGENTRREQTPEVRNGWAALRGWTCVLHNNLQEGLREFRSSDPVEGDPFGLLPAASFVQHLLALQEGESLAPESIDTSNLVWQEVFSPVLPPTTGHVE